MSLNQYNEKIERCINGLWVEFEMLQKGSNDLYQTIQESFIKKQIEYSL